MNNLTRRLLPTCIILLACLTACAPTTIRLTPGTPSVEINTASQTPRPAIATATATATATAKAETFSDSLGVSPEFAAKLKGEGINSTISGEKGAWTASQVISGWNEDGTPIVEQNIKIVSFEDASIHNAGYPDGILKGIDNQGKTVFWSENEKAWVRPLEISTDIEKPTFYPWGKQYLAIESVLLNPSLNKPFSDEAVKNFQGWSINFEYDEKTQTSRAYLRPRNSQSIRWALDENGKPIWFTTTSPDDVVYQSALTQLLNPADPANPKADETMFILASAGEWWISSVKIGGYRDLFNSWYIKGENQDHEPFTKTLLPQIILAQRNSWFAAHPWGSFIPRPSLNSLLSQPGNSLDTLGALGNNINYNIDQGLDNTNLVSTALEITKYPDLLKNLILLQKAIWPLFFTVSQ